MRTTVRYAILFAATMLVQTLVLDRLMLSVYFAPMIYTAVLLLLPVETPSVVNLFTGFGSGVVMDLLCGTAGLHTIASTAAGYIRRPLLTAIVGHEGMRDVNVPSGKTMGRRQYVQYLLIMTAFHAIVFYAVDSLTFGHFLYTALRFAVGTVSSLLMLWVTARLFTIKTGSRQ